MKNLIILAAVFAVIGAVESDIQKEWEKFKTAHGKAYEDDAEETFRMKIFKENKHKIAKHNARFDRGEVTFRVAINRHADMLPHEVAERLNGYRTGAGLLSRRSALVAPASAPANESDDGSAWPWHRKIDWREHGYVTDIKDQGQCGSCWAFSTTGSLEGQLFKKYGELVSLSEQNLVDCSSDYGNYGCSGGLMDQAFEYIKDNGGLDTEESYPYTGEDGSCAYSASNSGGTVTGYQDVHPTERALKDAVQKIGPISVAIDASNWSFQLYESGIYYEEYCSSTQLDHGVLLVGYGSDGWGKDYWIVKNSWGSSWGEDGYIRMARNRKNNCGIATEASYPLV